MTCHTLCVLRTPRTHAHNTAGASEWNLTADESGLSEVLNVAWAQHEIVSATTAASLDWLEQQHKG